ncbi:YppG family protein [Bacillus timonensis]|nr:YppG family protein [Bacillus timonensis]
MYNFQNQFHRKNKRNYGQYWPYNQNQYQYPLYFHNTQVPLNVQTTQPFGPFYTNNVYSKYPIGSPNLYPPNIVPYATPYPKPSPFSPQQPSGVNSIMAQFKKQDGSYDLNKMIDTAGQMMGAVNQISSMVKGVSGIFKA